MHRSGFVALVGRPNVGKSTLVNSLLGEKVAIVSDKPQTTRNRIRAILTREEAQVIFIDTPGVHKPKHKLGTAMVEASIRTFNQVDILCFLVEANLAPGPGDRHVASLFQKLKSPVFLVLNKIDLCSPEKLKAYTSLYRELYPFDAHFHLSAKESLHLEPLLESLITRLPEGPQYYPPDMVTDQPERFIAAELIREKIIHLTRDEIPFSIAVVIEEMTLREQEELIDIRAEIYVERKSQVGIVIGKSGSLLKQAGIAARQDLEALMGRQVYLDLWVKVKKDWRNRDGTLHQLGYDQI
jgi:GTPase